MCSWTRLAYKKQCTKIVYLLHWKYFLLAGNSSFQWSNVRSAKVSLFRHLIIGIVFCQREPSITLAQVDNQDIVVCSRSEGGGESVESCARHTIAGGSSRDVGKWEPFSYRVIEEFRVTTPMCTRSEHRVDTETVHLFVYSVARQKPPKRFKYRTIILSTMPRSILRAKIFLIFLLFLIEEVVPHRGSHASSVRF